MEQATRDLLASLCDISQDDTERLVRISYGMPFVADISRSDVLLYAWTGNYEAVVVAQARPHSIMPVYSDDLLGYRVGPEDNAAVFRAIRWGYRVRGSRRLITGGAPVIQGVWPVRGQDGRVIATLNIEAHEIAYVRQKSRSRVFRRAVRRLQKMLLLDELLGIGALSPFSQHDGILVVDSSRVTRYASGIVTDHYRKLGYLDSLVGRHLNTLDTGDNALFRQVFQDLSCHEAEFEERPHLIGAPERIWIRKAVPLIGYEWGQPWWQLWKWSQRRAVGVLFTIHDATEERRKEREDKIQSAMIQEIHHRVKNNLQTVASVLRMQIRRSRSQEVRRVLRDSVSRILSMAVVHEYLSKEEGQAINIREVTHRIIQQTRQGVVSPDKRIRIVLAEGNNLYLPPRPATACALVVNELLQNAIEHGYEARNVGTVSVEVVDEGDEVRITVADDGEGLPPGFDLGQATSLGLQIVQTLVQDDLRGTFDIRSGGGVQAIVQFSKAVLEGEERWNVQG
jgi:two-component sensor histidine kinase